MKSMTIWRVVMGISMTVGFIGLHALIAVTDSSDNAGRTFGWFESNSKWGAVIAGLIAGTAVHTLDVRAPFFIGGLTILTAGCYLAGLAFYRLRLRNY